ncbi:MAG: hypothetical protein IT318_24865 [Anaerolineales bacterium]|nr:hypothetical protein [Anaerolineales bacterium]
MASNPAAPVDDGATAYAPPAGPRPPTLDDRVSNLELAVFGSPLHRIAGLIERVDKVQDGLNALSVDVSEGFQAAEDRLSDFKTDVAKRFDQLTAAIRALRSDRRFWLQLVATLVSLAGTVYLIVQAAQAAKAIP